MSTVTERLPLIQLPIGEHKRGLGTIEVNVGAKTQTLPLVGVDIKAKVSDRIASVTVRQTFRNTFKEHLEATYIFPLAGGCVVSSFEMRIGSRVVKGLVKEREQARQDYAQALQDGRRAALLEQERDDVFTMQVGNIPPDEEIVVLLTYAERLPFFEDGRTELRLPLVTGDRYIPGADLDRNSVGGGVNADTDAVPDASRISPPRLVDGFDPKVSLTISAEIIQIDHSGANGLSDLSCSQHATQVALDADTVRIELARDDERLNRDFVLRWRICGKVLKSNLLTFKSGNDIYGMLSIAPPKRDGYLGAARDVLFLVDRSGSMMGIKMVSAIRACSNLLQTLGPRDRFAIAAFDDVMQWMLPHNASSRSGYFMDADEAGIEAGHKFLRTVEARGGTELHGALQNCLSEISKRAQSQGRIPVLVILTDGEVGDESRILKKVQQEIGDSRLFTVGIDTTPNSGLLKRMASLGGGTCTFVQPGTSLEAALQNIGREIGHPLVTDLQIEDGNGARIEIGTLAPQRIPDLFEGRATTAFFKLSATGTIRVHGKWSDGKKFDEVVKTKNIDMPAIAQLWAKTRITDMEDAYRVGPSPQLRQEIIDLAVKHSLLTKLTAFVAVDEAEVVNPDGTIRKVMQPVEKPHAWEMYDGATTGSQLPARAASSLMGQLYGSAPAPQPKLRKQVGSDAVDALSQSTGGWGAPPPAAPGSPAPNQQGAAKRSDASNIPASLGGASAKAKKDSGSTNDEQLNVSPYRIFQLPEPEAEEGSAPASAAPMPPQTGGGGTSGWQQIQNLAQQFFSGPAKDALSKEADSKRELEIKTVSDWLERFSKLLDELLASLKSGTVPNAAQLESDRSLFMQSLSLCELGTELPALQKFLRGAAVEMIASLKQENVTASELLPIWERHMKEFHQAQVETTNQLASSGGSGGRFWESSI